MSVSKRMKDFLEEVHSGTLKENHFPQTRAALFRRRMIKPSHKKFGCPWVLARNGFVELGLNVDHSPIVKVTIPKDEEGEIAWAMSWWKSIKTIDMSKARRRGWAFDGEFLTMGKQYYLEVDSIVVRSECIGKTHEERHSRQGYLYRVVGRDDLREELSLPWDTNFLDFLDATASALNASPIKFDRCSDEELVEELKVRGYHVEPTQELLKERPKHER